MRLDVDNYKPPFVTETDEARWDDCTVCSTLMAVASATLGKVVLGPDWRPMNAKELKVLRERIRNHLPNHDQTGPMSMSDMRTAFRIEYPWLPEIPFYDEQDNTWSEVVQLVKNGWVGVFQGNPIRVDNTRSKLRRWQANDNYGHAIHVDRFKTVDGKGYMFVMDPLGRDGYDGEWVPADEVRQFTETFGAGKVKANLFKRGGWSDEALARKESGATIRDLESKVTELRRTLVDVKADLVTVTKQRDEAKALLATAKTEITRLERRLAAAGGGGEVDCSDLESQLEVVEARVVELEAQVVALETEVSDLEDDAVEAQTRITELQNGQLAVGVAIDNLVATYDTLVI